jgi:cytochrome c-type biogenesis protein CcmH
MGKPGLPGQPFNNRVSQTPKPTAIATNEGQHGEINDMITNLRAKLDKNPNDIKSWELLGKTYLMQKKYSEAASTLERALQITPSNIGMRAAFGEALTLAADGRVTQKSESEFKAVEKHTPDDPRARYYLGLAEYQRNNLTAALRRWIALEIDTPADAPWRTMLQSRIQKAEKESGIDISALKLGEITKRPPHKGTITPNQGQSTQVSKPIPGPSQSQIAAAQNMTAKDRQSMIRSMVQRLADKLKDNPDDVDGWLRLARSYSVLKQSESAINAYSQAAKNAPNRIDIQLNFARALFPAGTPETEIPSRLKPVIENILKLDPNHPEATFYRGMIAKAEGDYSLAHELWTRLLQVMGPNAPARKSIEKQINSLKMQK